jgi:folate-binding protein YgfZ
MALRAFDVSLWGFFRIHGKDAKTFLQGLVTADLNKLDNGVCLPACVLTPKGLLVADCELYQETPETILAVTRPNAAIGFLSAFEKKIMLSDSTLKALRSQQAWLVIGEGFTLGLPWTRLGEPARLVLGVDPPEDAEFLTAEEFEALRVNAGFPWFGADMNADSLPLEARQDAAISMDKGCYMGQETVSRIVFRGHVNKILMGVRFAGEAPAAGSVVWRDGKEIGKVTSAAGSVGLAVAKYEDAVPGVKVTAADREGELFLFSSWPKPLSKPA